MQYLAIMLARIKLGFPEIRRALLDVDDQKLSMDELKAIAKHLPTTEEVRIPRSSDGVYAD
jgi:diaphanous 1